MNKKQYICIHCKQEFCKVPPVELNECRYGIKHFIVKKTDLEKIKIKRKVVSV